MQRRRLMKMANSFDGRSTKSHFHPAKHDGLSCIESIERPSRMEQAEAEISTHLKYTKCGSVGWVDTRVDWLRKNPLSPGEPRRTLLNKRGGALPQIFGDESAPLRDGLTIERVCQR